MFWRGCRKFNHKARVQSAFLIPLGLIAGLTVTGMAAVSPVASTPALAIGTPITDDFSTNNYSGGTPIGVNGWGPSWTEANDDTTPEIYDTGRITANTGALQFSNIDNRTVGRAVDLSGFDVGATVSFTVVSEAGDERLNVLMRTGDGPTDFVELASTPSLNPAGTRYTFVLTSAMIRANGEVRFVGRDADWGNGDVIVVDDIEFNNPSPNPDLANSCGVDVTVILDESGSIDSAGAIGSVETAVKALGNGLVGTGSTLRLVEFSTNGRDSVVGGSTAKQPVTQSYVDGALNTYLTTGSSASDPANYQPNNANGQVETFTNWEAGLYRAGNVAPTNAPITPLVFFITDGDPNTVGIGGTSTDNNLGSTAFSPQASAAAYQEAAILKAAGAHLIGVGVGGASVQASFDRLTQIVESQNPVTWVDPNTPLDIRTTDAIRVASFTALENALRQAVSELCSQSLDITKVDQAGNPIVGREFKTTVAGQAGSESSFKFLDPAGNAPTSAAVLTGATGLAEFQWSPVGQVTAPVTPATWTSRATFTEQLSPGWTLPASPGTCSVAPGNTSVALSAIVDGTGLATFTVDHTFRAGETVSCRVVNNAPGTIKIIKRTDPATMEEFTFTPTGWNSGETFKLTNNGAKISEALKANQPAGTYRIAETGLPVTWSLDSISCDNGSTKDDINVLPGQVTTCTVTNKKAGTLIVRKVAVNGNNTFGFSGAVTGSITTPNGNSLTASLPAGTDYTVTEGALPEGWKLNSATCDNQSGTLNSQTRELSGIVVASGQTVICTFTNEATSLLSITKTVTAGQPTVVDGDTFRVAYDIEVKNAGPGPSTYTLTDTPQFPTGATVTAFTAVGPGGALTLAPPTAGVYTLVTDDPIGGGSIATPTVEKYTVTVEFDVAATLSTEDRTCGTTSTPNKGAFNSAAITYPGGSASDDDCVNIPGPSADLAIVKTASADTVDQGRPVSFELKVTNNGPNAATDVVVSDTVPAQLAITGVTSSDFTCSFTGQVITCTRPTLAVGASGTITVAAIVNSGVVGTVSNTGTVTGRQPDPNPSNNSFTDSIVVPEVAVFPPEAPPLPLPSTGSNIDSLIAIAMSLLAAGFALMLMTVKRRRQLI